ncbi:hypothetical protein [Solidesulfovibrio sp. C21]|uniref:hypothetical protein n=1 Tax=Solidesulfovibrio sp. C21 TaxID=3398613 RepID=UPI0039FBFE30
MLQSCLLAFVLTFVFVCVPQSSFAALHVIKEFSAQTPDDWKFYRDDSVISFTAPDDSADISIFLEQPEKPNLQEITRVWAGQNPVKTLADTSFIWEDSAGSRYWMLGVNYSCALTTTIFVHRPRPQPCDLRV